MIDKVLIERELLERIAIGANPNSTITEMEAGWKGIQELREMLTHPIAAQSAPAGEREAFEAAVAAVNERGWTTSTDLARQIWDSCAAWQRAQSAPVVPEGWRVSVVDYGNRTGEASISGPGVYCMQVPVSYSMLDFMQALAASYRRNQSEPAAHEGWRLVPVEPTEEMIDAGCREHTCVQGDSWYSDSEISEHDAIAVFKAMLAAAPQPAAQELCNCPGGNKPEPHKHAPNCPYRAGAAARQEQGDEVRRLREALRSSRRVVESASLYAASERHKEFAGAVLVEIDAALSPSAEGKA